MFCYNCGCHLSEHDFCTACGADVSLYKKIMGLSNRFYNDGLEKAEVRDLTGAINSLRQSLKLNKDNIDARNLLGLVYFETGEVVAALSEWVISKNMRPDKNIADDYIERLQSNSSRLDAINQTIKKYNQAYAYCLQDSKDLAIIQLKKVLSLNPRFIRAHLLLALLYMDSEEWERADRELRKCMDIDRNNTLTLRYQKEVKLMLTPDESVKQSARRSKKDEVVRYQSDNEVIIQPLNVKDTRGGGVSTLVNIGIGILIGLAAMYFLVVPAKILEVNNEAQRSIQRIGEESDAKTVQIQELEKQITKLEADNSALHQELDGYVGADGTLSTIDNLLEASSAYLKDQDIRRTGEMLENIARNVNMEETSEQFQQLYQTLITLIGPDLSQEYYSEGYKAYREADYTTAIDLLSKAVYYDAANEDALYNLGNAYHQSGDVENANATYEKVVELFPGTNNANRARRYITEQN
ncbi:MAG: tetratricopeptide repeat protein [Lachnoclostridium sp.]|nr:tetratricopeptide repeat protein [Lachnospira sp.]MCM1247448.1 tetratricopeptide repeat protein [Lachnoclostridium sp.]MCM1536196.1 tetratricopeptide repeat protein [Clostridium sp.]